jgi:hypothetical protein
MVNIFILQSLERGLPNLADPVITCKVISRQLSTEEESNLCYTVLYDTLLYLVLFFNFFPKRAD